MDQMFKAGVWWDGMRQDVWKVWVSSFSGPRALMLCVHKPGANAKLNFHLPAAKRTSGRGRKGVPGSLLRLTFIIRCLYPHGLGDKTLSL